MSPSRNRFSIRSILFQVAFVCATYLGPSAQPSLADSVRPLNQNEQEAASFVNRAIWLRKQGLFSPAERKKLVERAITICPDRAEFYCELAEECRRLSDYSAEIDAADRALKLNDRDGMAWFEKGMALVHLEGYQAGCTALENSVEIEPTNIDAWSALAAYRSFTSRSEGEDTYRHCLEVVRSPGWESNLLFRTKSQIEVHCLRSLGQLYRIDKRYSEAIKFNKEALAADVDHEESSLIQIQLKEIAEQLKLVQ